MKRTRHELFVYIKLSQATPATHGQSSSVESSWVFQLGVRDAFVPTDSLAIIKVANLHELHV